jgi:hypothetical protein
VNIEGVVDAIIDLIKVNLIAKTDLTSDASTGDVIVKVENSFNFLPGQEIVLIDYGYNDPSSEHYNSFEYAVVKSVIDTNTIELNTPLISSWLLSEESFIQKTIAHSPLYEQNVLYGDREVIPTDEVAITIEPMSISNDWIYIQGGLNEESRVQITIYGQSTETDEGMRILNKYSKAVYDILNLNMHLNVNDIQTPLFDDINIGDDTFCICDNEENRKNFTVGGSYSFQDNLTPRCAEYCVSEVNISGGEICLKTKREFNKKYSKNEFAIAIKMNRYFYDTRVDSVTFGVIQKGSAVLRASQLSWFGKEVNELPFPQYDRKSICFDKNSPCETTSSP